MTYQEIFDKVCEKLSAQKQRCLAHGDGGCCVYNGPDGLHCAIGHLVEIPMEYNFTSFGDLPMQFKEKIFEHTLSAQDLDFLQELQQAHDLSFNLHQIRMRLLAVADDYRLNSESARKITSWEE